MKIYLITYINNEGNFRTRKVSKECQEEAIQEFRQQVPLVVIHSIAEIV